MPKTSWLMAYMTTSPCAQAHHLRAAPAVAQSTTCRTRSCCREAEYAAGNPPCKVTYWCTSSHDSGRNDCSVVNLQEMLLAEPLMDGQDPKDVTARKQEPNLRGC